MTNAEFLRLQSLLRVLQAAEHACRIKIRRLVSQRQSVFKLVWRSSFYERNLCQLESDRARVAMEGIQFGRRKVTYSSGGLTNDTCHEPLSARFLNDSDFGVRVQNLTDENRKTRRRLQRTLRLMERYLTDRLQRRRQLSQLIHRTESQIRAVVETLMENEDFNAREGLRKIFLEPFCTIVRTSAEQARLER